MSKSTEEKEETAISDYSNQVKIWTEIIGVQKHFNEIKSKNQTLFISAITALIIAAGYLYSKDSTSFYLLNDFKIYYYSIPILGAATIVIPFAILDYSIYQVLLSGAVECGKKFEYEVLGQELTSHIIDKEANEDSFLWVKGSKKKLELFYYSFIIVFLCLFFALNVFH